MKKRVGYIVLLFALLLWSCADEAGKGGFGTDRKVLIDLSLIATPECTVGEGTRAVDVSVDEGYAASYKVKDLWLLQFDRQKNLIGTPVYQVVDPSSAEAKVSFTVAAPAPEEGEYTCHVIANTHDPNKDWAALGVTTEDSFKALVKKVGQVSDLYQTDAAGEHDLLMNGQFKVDQATVQNPSIQCLLYRNVLKYTFEIELTAGSGLTSLTSFQIFNIPENMYYADQSYQGNLTFPTEGNFISLPQETFDLKPGAQKISFTYYLPRNCRGNNASDNALHKNTDAPQNATYVQLKGKNASNGHDMCYTFYLGMNMSNNFDLHPNHKYHLTMTISDIGDPTTDSRVQDLSSGGSVNPPIPPMESMVLPESNSYIIQPNAQVIYSLPVAGRVNAFWGSSLGGSTEKIAAGTEWIATVIWQDSPSRVIDFVTTAPNEEMTATDQFEGKGTEPLKFRLSATARFSNVIVGVSLKNDPGNCLWSWHLWVTDYDPAYGQQYSEGPWASEYKNKKIMDRNLGAFSDLPGSDSFGLYYQFGRKDPFPGTRNMYDIKGILMVPIGAISHQATFAESVQNPMFYYVPGDAADWASPNDNTGREWNNPSSSAGTKSLFDPCPPGWKVPVNGVWEYFKKYHLQASLFDRGGVLFPIVNAQSAWYPAAGYYDVSGRVLDQSAVIFNWSSSPSDVKSAFGIAVDVNADNQMQVKQSGIYQRSMGAQIRCVQE